MISPAPGGTAPHPCECCGCEVDGLYGYATCDDCHVEPTDEEGDTGKTLEYLFRLHGSQLTQTIGDPGLKRKWDRAA
jgi:hypothetical protein